MTGLSDTPDMDRYKNILPSGGDTGAGLNLHRRIEFIRKHIDLTNKMILDCGCGSGDYVLKFLEFSPHVYGMEHDAKKVEAFRSRSNRPERVQQGNIEHMNFDDNTFDCVLLNEVLEHVPDDIQALSEILRVLKPRGALVVFAPNRLYPFETHAVTLKFASLKIPYYFPFIPYIPVGLGRRILTYHARNYFPWELRNMITKAGFQVERQTVIWQTFENISGHSPRLIRLISPFLRKVSLTGEKLPLLKFFGVSQAIIARKKAQA